MKLFKASNFCVERKCSGEEYRRPPFVSVFAFSSPACVWQAELFKVNTGSVPQKIMRVGSAAKTRQTSLGQEEAGLLSADLTRPPRPRRGCSSRAGPPLWVGPPTGSPITCAVWSLFLVWLGMSHQAHSPLPCLDFMIHRLVNLTSRRQQEVGSCRKQVVLALS